MSLNNDDDDKLGVLEFCVALNGEDPFLALKCLRRFSQTIQKERKLAFLGICDEDDGDSHDGNENDGTSNDKSIKKDEEWWKKDSKSYNVPFVGTSVAKGDVGTVTMGEWPTGLLKAYLQVSPQAKELTIQGGDFQPPSGVMQKLLLRRNNSNHKKSIALHKAYLQALHEIITAAIPKHILYQQLLLLQRQSKKNPNNNPFSFDPNDKTHLGSGEMMSAIMKEQFPKLLENLNHHLEYNTDVSSLIIMILTNMTYTSIGAAREVARGLDSQLKDGVLKKLFHHSSSKKNINKKKRKADDISTPTATNEDDKDHNNLDKDRMMDTRTACLCLSSALIKSADSIVISFVTSFGNKERKMNPGIVYLALRGGLSDPCFFSGNIAISTQNIARGFLNSVEQFLSSFRDHLLSPNETTTKAAHYKETKPYLQKPLLSPKNLSDLLTGEPLEQIVRISSSAGTFSSYHNVLNGAEEEGEKDLSNALLNAATEARRFMFLLLLDIQKSPFLQILHSSTSTIEKVSYSYIQQLSRCLLSILHHVSSSSLQLLPTREFILACLHNSPQFLVAEVFRNLTPNTFLNDQQQQLVLEPTYSCLSYLAFMSYLIKSAPSVWSCLPSSQKQTKIIPSKVDQLLCYVLPKSISKNMFTKALNNTNVMLVMEGLKLLISVLKRAKDFVLSFQKQQQQSENEFYNENDFGILSNFTEGLCRKLPDLQTIVALRSKFDPYVSEDESKREQLANFIVGMSVCEVLDLYASFLPQSIDSINFDWMKLLPDSHDCFFMANPILQRRLLQTLYSIYFYKSGLNGTIKQKKVNLPSIKSFHTLLSILIHSKTTDVYDIARKISVSFVLQSIGNQDTLIEKNNDYCDDIYQCIEYEASLWVDILSRDIILPFCKLLEEIQKNNMTTIHYSFFVSQVWQMYFPTKQKLQLGSVLSFSPLLLNAFGSIITNVSSEIFNPNMTQTVCKIATKMLLYSFDPLPLACVVTHFMSNDEFVEKCTAEFKDDNELIGSLHALKQHSQALVKNDATKLSIKSLNETIFRHSQLHALCLEKEIDTEKFREIFEEYPELALSVFRQNMQQQRLSGGSSTDHELVGMPMLYTLQYNDRNACCSILKELLRVDGCSSFSPNGNVSLFMVVLSWNCITQTEARDSLYEFLNTRVKVEIENSIVNFRNSTDYDYSRKLKAVLNIAAISKIVGQEMVDFIIGSILQFCNKEFRSQRSVDPIFTIFLSNLLRYKLLSLNNDFSTTHPKYPVGQIFDFWKLLAEKKIEDALDNNLASLCRFLESSMSRILLNSEMNGVLSSKLFMRLCHDIPNFVNLAFAVRTEVKDMNGASVSMPHVFGLSESKDDFLEAILMYDFNTFARPLLNCIMKAIEDDTFLHSNNSLCFDRLVSVLLGRLKRVDSIESFIQNETFSILIDRYCSKASILIQQSSRDLSWNISFKSIMNIMKDLILCGNHNANIYESFFQSLIIESKKWMTIPKSCARSETPLTIYSFLYSISVSNGGLSMLHFVTCKAWKIFGSYTHICLSKALPYVLRAKVEFDNKIMILNVILSLVDVLGTLDQEIFQNNSEHTRILLAVCLKHGVTNSGDLQDQKIAFLCLRIVRKYLLLKSTLGDESSYFHPSMVSLNIIHNMIVSHSKFRDAICGDTFDGVTKPSKEEDVLGQSLDTKLELIEILTLCVTDKSHDITIDRNIWSIILKSYDASLSKKDWALRQLMHMYDSNSKKGDKEHEPYMDELRWGEHQLPEGIKESPWDENSQVSSDHGLNWEWFIQGLDTIRIRKTIEKFPVTDVLDPLHSDATMDGTDLEEMKDEMSNSDDDESIESASEDSTKNNQKHTQIERECNKSTNHFDKRYSPGFILPLVLATLETFAPSSLSMMNTNNTTTAMAQNADDEIDGSSERNNKFIKIVVRLNNKGAFALALASLSSNCLKLRQVAVSILYFFLLALNSEEARNLNTWRERPQLAMVINSVQRSFAARRSMQMQKEKEASPQNDDDYSSKSSIIPMLPAVASTFLAKSLYILTRPGDDLYSQMNRFFLRLDKFHGAFMDCFSLPAFVYLFCSVSNDALQARKERLWALQLLKSGMVDMTSYKVTIRCHVPELLLTSFETRGSHEFNSNDEVEQLLVIDTVIAMLNNGGSLARHHLLTKIGLLSWIFRILEGERYIIILPTNLLRCQFLRLIKTSIVSMIDHFDNCQVPSYVTTEIVSMCRPLINMYSDSERDNLSLQDYMENIKSQSLPTTFLSVLCEVFWEIHKSLVHSFDDSRSTNFGVASHSGISIPSACRILDALRRKTPRHSYDRMIISLCHFNFLPGDEFNSPDDITTLCSDVLSYFLQPENDKDMIGTNGFVATLLNYIKNLLRAFPDTLCHNVSIISNILACRKRAASNSNTLDIWNDCVKISISNLPESMETDDEFIFKVANDILSNTSNV